jgi:hypothetical protein
MSSYKSYYIPYEKFLSVLNSKDTNTDQDVKCNVVIFEILTIILN